MVVDYCNYEQLYNSIIELLDNEQLRQSLIKKGKQSVKPFELELFIKKLEKLYEQS